MESEVTLVLRAQQRRRDAFESLMAIHERPLLYYIARQIGDLERARDVSQEVWLTVWRSLPKLKEPRCFRGWIYRIAHQRVALFFRQLPVQEMIGEAQAVQGEPVELDSVTDLDVEELRGAIDQLPPVQREVILLHYLAELAIDDVAMAVGCAPGTVKSRLFHARLELRRLLQKETDHGQ